MCFFHKCAGGQHAMHTYTCIYIYVYMCAICGAGWVVGDALAHSTLLLLPLASSDWPSCDEESCTRRGRRSTALDAIIHGTNDIIYYGPATRNLLCPSSSSTRWPQNFSSVHTSSTLSIDLLLTHTLCWPLKIATLSCKCGVKASNKVLNRACWIY